MIILGISALDNESTASLVVDGRIIAAASEERFTRQKQQDGFPHRALDWIFRSTGVRPTDVDLVGYPFFQYSRELWLQARAFAADIPFTLRHDDAMIAKAVHLANYFRITFLTRLHARSDRWLRGGLKRYGLLAKLRRVDHHRAHAASAFYTSGFDRALVVTLDGYGSGASGAIFVGEGRRLRRLQVFHYPHSLGALYWRVTKALGFTPLRHEGKVLGLAAFGDPAVLGEIVSRRFDLRDADMFRIKSAQNFLVERVLARRYRREDVASAYQKVLEIVATQYVAAYLRRTGCHYVAGAGGVFANVRMNQKIAELEGVEKIFVHPAMGDSGSGTGAALHLAAQFETSEFARLEHVYLGPEYDDPTVHAALRRSGLPYRRVNEVEREVARLLAQGKVVARFNGRMEYGPRALGNRSILYQACDPRVNRWLNERLRRTEFMPFAPATLAKYADEYYSNINRSDLAAQFMTITANCSDKMRGESPAAVHIDGTARPQLVNQDVNSSFFRVLSEYHALTGIPSVINTSFNMHEEPIVCSPEDALKAFTDGRLDFLTIGDYLVGPGSPAEAAP
jgi:carbamoyltransferase